MKIDLAESHKNVCEKIHLNKENQINIDQKKLANEAKKLIKDNEVLFVAHYYTEAILQEIAEETGGIVADSLEIARFCAKHPAKKIILAGVYFMGETVKILCPEKKIFVLTQEAQCSLDLGCPVNEFREFKENNPGRTVVAYINTSANVKAEADWVTTSRIAIPVIEHLTELGEKILWAPDKHMGTYLQKTTSADMVLWDGSCIVHDSFKVSALVKLKKEHPDAAILAHPEAPLKILEIADFIGSTKDIVDAAVHMKNQKFIVATDDGIFYKLKQKAPNKIFIQAPSGGVGATCKSCAHCPWMELNQLPLLIEALKSNGGSEVNISSDLIKKASIPLFKMLDFYEELRKNHHGF